MKISSSYYDYYSQNYAVNSYSTAKTSGEDSTDSSQSKTEELGFSRRRAAMAAMAGNTMNLSFTGKMMKDKLQISGSDSQEIHEKMEMVKSDMESVKTADIDNMTADEVKNVLTKIEGDMEAMKKPDESKGTDQQKDISEMTEAEMREMLKNIQEHAQNAPEMGQGRPPVMGGFNPSDMMSGIAADENSSEASNDGIQNILQQVLDKLTESYDSSAESSDEYVKKLKESLTSAFNQQKGRIEDFSTMLFNKLDNWSSQGKNETKEV